MKKHLPNGRCSACRQTWHSLSILLSAPVLVFAIPLGFQKREKKELKTKITLALSQQSEALSNGSAFFTVMV